MASTSVLCTDTQLIVVSLVSCENFSSSKEFHISPGSVGVGQCHPISSWVNCKARILDLGKESFCSFSCKTGGNTTLEKKNYLAILKYWMF